MSIERALREALHNLADELKTEPFPLDKQLLVARLYELAGDDTRAETKAAEEAAARPQRLSDLLLLVGFKIEHYRIAAWKPEHQKAAEEWAVATHLSASDNNVEVPDRPRFLVRYTEEYRDQDAHHCHFCGTYVLAGYESNGDRHWLSDCRPDLVEHEPGEVCTWSGLEIDADVRNCYAYQDRDYPPEMSPNDPFRWTDEHAHFDEDGPM